MTGKRTSDAGSYSLETAVLAPVMFAVLGLMIAFGRVTMAGSSVDAAARAAARAASLDLSPAAAQSDAERAARSSLSGDGTACTNVVVAVNTAGFSAPLGQTGTAQATVTCTAQLADIALPGLPGTKTLRSQFTSPVDAYRPRALGFAHSDVAWSTNRSVGAEQ